MERAVRDFKTLGRSKTTPSGLDNKWVFGIRHVDLNPPGDLLLAVHPVSRFVLQGGPAQILSQPTERDRARAAVIPLLQAFSKGSPGAEHAAFAPWSWSTDSSELAAAIGPELAAAGISGGLEPGADTAASSAVSPGDSSKCHGCSLSSENFSSPMKKCSACLKAWYHSQDCQRSHWKEHKPTCVANRPKTQAPEDPSATPSSEVAYNYYNNVARKSPEGQALMRSLHLDPISTHKGLSLPLRRLVITGKDTPENMQVLFGPTFLSQKNEHERIRLEILLDAPRGSPVHKMAEFDDAGVDRLTRAVRPPSQTEQETMKEVREIQKKVQRKIGVGNSPDSGVMREILMTMGPNWPEKMHLYTLAINTMDQGVDR
ncbi:hypothetical protein BDP81DRAFT_308743 [Colletotrichum phormii]|uniref:MYND-type domain-containing protein n=1 Tax=Colletotrichum phormii TaxID=359342 RepID=A0AAJ0A4Q1_9PEZI|nr:uncharacterized protein BDP81DRAFT_308743 [Colletotrichum phormii]KAK1655031.1 hypothetical protein BDP81DRAFT_308743 [Colletotrichum phormii]